MGSDEVLRTRPVSGVKLESSLFRAQDSFLFHVEDIKATLALTTC
jgi:hypothetical protein